MPSEPTSSNSMQTQINALRTSMEASFAKIEQLITGLDARLRAIEQSEAGCRGVQELKLQAHDKQFVDLNLRIANLEKKCEVLEEALETKEAALKKELADIKPVINFIKWVGGILGAAIVALIWAMITGQVQLLFK